jgi:uncharacterized membrane protein
MSELSNKMQSPDGDDRGQEAQQPSTGSPWDHQDMPEGNYQQGLPPEQGRYQQNIPPGSNQQYGYQPYPPGQQQYEYQQPYGTPYMGDVGPNDRTGLGMKARTAGLLCYLFAWVTGLIFFLLERESRFVRFHAMQSILFFGILSILQWVFSHLPFFGYVGGALGVVMFIGWIVMMVKAGQGKYYKLPLFGDLADRLIDQIRV